MKRILGSVLAVLMLLSSFGTFVYAEDAELAATDWTQKILSVKAGSFADETHNYSSKETMWDPQTEYHYQRFVSFQGSNDAGNKDYGGGSPVVYIGNWSIGDIPSAELGGKFYVGMLVRTNSASTPVYNPLLTTGTGSKEVSAAAHFKGTEEWEFNSIDFELPTTLTSFTHGHLKFGTAAGSYIDVAAWGLFASTVSKADAEAALQNASKVSEAEIVTTSIADTDGNIIKSHLVGTVTLPVLESTEDTIFSGWTDTKGGTTIVAAGGANYTPSKSVILYPVYSKKVRFVDGTVSASGDGLTAETAYKTFAEASSALGSVGGTIVVSGKTANFSLNNTADIVITSVYDGVDYRENGAELNFGSGYNYIILGYSENPGKVTFENITTVQPASDGWHLMGHDVVIGSGVNSLTAAGASANIQLMAVCSSNATPPASISRVFNITVDNTTNTSIILGPRKPMTIAGAELIINGQLNSIAVSNNTYEAYDWLDTSPSFGQLTVNGDVKITVNGKLMGNILSRKHVLTADSYDYGLNEISGNIGVIVNYGGTYAGSFDNTIKERTKGNWIKVTGIEGTTLSYGENANDIILTLDEGLDYNFVTLTNTTSGNVYPFFVEDGVSEFTLTESGIYTMALSKNEKKTITYVDTKGGNTFEAVSAFENLEITLPTLDDTDILYFEGWTDVENGTEVKYQGGASYTVTEDKTFYAVWAEAETYTITFMNGDKEFATFKGMEGKTILYPDDYPVKADYYFAGWDKNPETIGAEDITINAIFKTVDEIGYHLYYWNGDAAAEGDGTYAKPFKQMSALVKALNLTGGTVVLLGRGSVLYQPTLANKEDVIFTALDPLTGKYFGGEFESGAYSGGHLYLPQGVYWGGTSYQTGAIIFENIDILNFYGQYGIGHMTFDGHPYVIGENVRHMSPETGAEINWFTGGTSPYNTAKPNEIKGIFKSPFAGSNWMVRGGGNFEIDKVEYDFYANSNLNLAQDGADVVTVNGPLLLTFHNGSSGSRIYHSRTSYAFGVKAYASIILNDGVTIKNELNVSDTGLAGKLYVIKSSEGATVTHTEVKGKYYIESDEYNYAKLINSEGTTVDEGIIIGGREFTAPEYGEYTVDYSNESLYGVKYVTTPYDDICPPPYAVTAEETDKHTITLPVLEKQNAHSFAGWTATKSGTTAELSGGSEYTLTGEVTLYAVWTAIPTFTVTFKNDNGETIHTSTGYMGAPLTFPENDPYKYGKKLLGYAYEGTTDIIAEDALIPDENKVAVPVWGEIPANETRLYVNADSGNDENSGISPDAPLATITKAVTLLKDTGGFIIVTGGKNAIAKNWNNAGDITLTSLDPVSGIDYRATELSADKLSFTDGAVITYAYTPFGNTTITGKVTIDNVTLLNATNNQFLCFEGHPYEIGKGISVYQQTADDAQINTSILQARSLGEGGSSKTNPEGIVMTVNGLENGTPTIYTVGKANNTVSGVTLTVDSYYNGSLLMGNDSGGGLTTIKGDVKLTFNGSMKNALSFTGEQYTNPVEGNVYAIYNNGSTANIFAMKLAEGFGIYSLIAGDNVVLSHGENGAFIVHAKDGIGSDYIKITDESDNIIQYISATDGEAEITLAAAGKYTAQFTDIALRRLEFVTGDENTIVSGGWYTENSEVEIPTELYRYGYKFKGWTDGTNTYTEGLITMPNKNITLTAIWEDAPKHTVTFDANGSDIAVPSDIYDYAGENIVLEKISSDNSTFIGWSEDKDAKIGVLNHTISSDTTLYAITSDGPVYVVDSYYRGDPNNYTGNRNSFRRYVLDVYLENAVASSGSFKLNTDNKFLYYLGHVPQEGITATVNAQVVSGSSGTPGLQYYTTPSVEFTWTSDAPIDTTNGRIRIARIMMYFSSWGMGYNQIEMRTTDEVISPFAGYTAKAGTEEALVTANFYKGVKSDEVKITGKITLEGRESGETAKYDYLKLYILDDAGDAVEFKVLEDENSEKRTFAYTTEIIPGNYTFRVLKDGYITRNVPITIAEAMHIPEIVLFAGDTLDENGNGDGVIDIDDFTRILRGFSKDFPLDKYINAIDLNEDGTVNVSDLAMIKNSMTSNVKNAEFVSSVDKNTYKLSDWKVSVNGNTISVVGGSDAAVENALSHIENMYNNGDVYRMPTAVSHTEDYEISSIALDGVSLNKYRIVIAENDAIAAEYAQYIYDYIAEISGYGLDIVYDTEDAYDYEILVGATSRKDNPITAVEEYSVYEEDGKLYVFYGDEQSAEMACLDLCEKILGKDSEGYDGFANVVVQKGASCSGKWSVLARFGVMSDSHVGVRYNWANYNWLYNTFANFENIHAENPLDFIVSLGDNIDDGYANTYATDYGMYLEEIKQLDICDPVNPIDGRAEGMIPHYELGGNHDPIGDQLDANGNPKIRFFKNRLWYTENEDGEKVAHIGFFTNYGGYPLHDYSYSGSYASYFSYGKVDDAMVKFVEDSIIEANAQGAKHIILYNHWGMSQQVGSPMLPETGLGKIADVCEKYGIKLYFNGHEHDIPYSLRRYNEIYDYDVSMTSQKHAVVEITTLRAKVSIYYSADNSLYREDIVPLSGRGEAKQTFAK